MRLVRCDQCSTDAEGTEYQDPAGWISVRVDGEHAADFCSTNCHATWAAWRKQWEEA